MQQPKIILKKVKVHNLKSVDLTLDPHQLIVFTGVSGSGKSSLAFDTIYVEGQRRYVESLSTYARRHLGDLQKPNAELISGISPTIAIEQKSAGYNPRSTVGTMTNIYDFLRVLYARIGLFHCPISGEVVKPQTTAQIAQSIQLIPQAAPILLLAPFAKKKKGEFKEDFADLMRKGFTRVRLDGRVIDLSEEVKIDGKLAHDVDIVIDRLRVDAEEKNRLMEGINSALECGKGVMSVLQVDENIETLYSQHAYSPKSGFSYGPLNPMDFSFNHPSGMCLTCQGLGVVDEKKCPICLGERIKPYPAATTVGKKRISSVTSMSIDEALCFFSDLKLTAEEKLIAEELVKEIKERLFFLKGVGLDYITLDRSAPTLSGGEAQRVRLASQIGSGLVGATYVLDEPSIGLHPCDNTKLIATLRNLRDKGNTVIVVEHDEETIHAADTIVDVGPLAGKNGGEILACGSYEELLSSKRSLTAAYLLGNLSIPLPKKRRSAKGQCLIEGACHHNLKKINVSIPLGVFVAVTGVSGSGKSSLIIDTLYPALSNALHKASLPVGKHKKISGWDLIDKIIAIDQSPIGRTPRSNPATYIKLFDAIRDLFSQLPQSMAQGYSASRFSFNVKEGACPHCLGMGMMKIDMDFLEDQWIPCEVCQGKRFDENTLSILYKGKTIYDILEMSVEESAEFFSELPLIKSKLDTLKKVGLDYMRIGQPSPTLSGGEAQRIKLAKELARPSTGNTLYILDEPTTGLHFHDIKKLIDVLQELVDKGNSILVIEHNMDLVKAADWVIDLGPEGGSGGGEVIAEGPPEKIIKAGTATGIALKKRFAMKREEWPSLKQESFDAVVVKGATQNNLKAVDAIIPRGKITLCTGPSGSGKSSFAFETVYAEGQRRYIESLSPYARQFVKQMPKPKVESIEGLSPAIAIEQKSHAGNPRSTIGTMTESYDYLRILFAHLGIAHSPDTKEEIRSITPDFIVKHLLSLPAKTKLHILSPLTLKRSESFEEVKERLQRQGFVRIRLNTTYYELEEQIPFDKQRKNELFLVIDRVIIASSEKKRLLDAVNQAALFSHGTLIAATETKDLFFNLSFADPTTGKSYPPITPHTFSFNTEQGMCLDCSGLGIQYGADLSYSAKLLKLCAADLLLLLWKEYSTPHLLRLLKKLDIDTDTPLSKLSSDKRHLFFHGSSNEIKEGQLKLRWIGLNQVFANLSKSSASQVRASVTPLLKTHVCFSCEGTRLNPLARHVTLNGHTIAQTCAIDIDAMQQFLEKINLDREHTFLEETLRQLKARLNFLQEIGLGYLSLDRSAPTLSGGEAQRIRLARQLGSGLTGCLYVLDEPTIGLHPHDNERLNRALKNLSELGNTLLLVEHDPLTIAIADNILDFGPGAGRGGGKVIAQGSLEQILKNPDSLTGAYLSGKKEIPLPKTRRKSSQAIEIRGAALHNLKQLDIDIPTHLITCITGVSGSGKSTLMNDLLRPALNEALSSKAKSITYKQTRFSNLNLFDTLLVLDQNPIGHTKRADVCTYSDLLTPLRYLFASLPEAIIRGLATKHFSYNHRRGMCTSCWGLGTRTVQLQFLPSVRITCETCQGFRLNPLSLTVTYKGKHLGHILQMSVEDALDFLPPIPKAQRILNTLIDVGLPYLQLGQEIATLSGGEAQRLRLVRELAKRTKGHTLYLFDEPTVGLHPDDIVKLLHIFERLIERGHSVILIEHNLDVIAFADYLIDLGPGSGPHGGHLIACGTPEELASHETSHTGYYLKSHLKKGK